MTEMKQLNSLRDVILWDLSHRTQFAYIKHEIKHPVYLGKRKKIDLNDIHSALKRYLK